MFIKSLIIVFILLFGLAFAPTKIFARLTVSDLYQKWQAEYQNNLAKISDPAKKQSVEQANQLMKDINQEECARFDTDIAKMAAIMDELKSRQHITKTVVAYGQGNTPLDQAEYYLNYAEEAVAYQKVQDYTPDLSGGNLKAGVSSSMNDLNYNLLTLQGKMLKAKSEVGLALDYYEK